MKRQISFFCLLVTLGGFLSSGVRADEQSPYLGKISYLNRSMDCFCAGRGTQDASYTCLADKIEVCPPGYGDYCQLVIEGKGCDVMGPSGAPGAMNLYHVVSPLRIQGRWFRLDPAQWPQPKKTSQILSRLRDRLAFLWGIVVERDAEAQSVSSNMYSNLKPFFDLLNSEMLGGSNYGKINALIDASDGLSAFAKACRGGVVEIIPGQEALVTFSPNGVFGFGLSDEAYRMLQSGNTIPEVTGAAIEAYTQKMDFLDQLELGVSEDEAGINAAVRTATARDYFDQMAAVRQWSPGEAVAASAAQVPELAPGIPQTATWTISTDNYGVLGDSVRVNNGIVSGEIAAKTVTDASGISQTIVSNNLPPVSGEINVPGAALPAEGSETIGGRVLSSSMESIERAAERSRILPSLSSLRALLTPVGLATIGGGMVIGGIEQYYANKWIVESQKDILKGLQTGQFDMICYAEASGGYRGQQAQAQGSSFDQGYYQNCVKERCRKAGISEMDCANQAANLLGNRCGGGQCYVPPRTNNNPFGPPGQLPGNGNGQQGNCVSDCSSCAQGQVCKTTGGGDKGWVNGEEVVQANNCNICQPKEDCLNQAVASARDNGLDPSDAGVQDSIQGECGNPPSQSCPTGSGGGSTIIRMPSPPPGQTATYVIGPQTTPASFRAGKKLVMNAMMKDQGNHPVTLMMTTSDCPSNPDSVDEDNDAEQTGGEYDGGGDGGTNSSSPSDQGSGDQSQGSGFFGGGENPSSGSISGGIPGQWGGSGGGGGGSGGGVGGLGDWGAPCDCDTGGASSGGWSGLTTGRLVDALHSGQTIEFAVSGGNSGRSCTVINHTTGEWHSGTCK